MSDVKTLVMYIALAGMVLNLQKNYWCFYLWMISNAFWCIYNYSAGENEQAVIFAVFFISCIIGIVKWKHSGKD